MTRPLLLLTIALLCLIASASAASQPTACDVLTKTDVAAAQGQEFFEARLSAATTGPLAVSQCFYRLPAFEKSVSVTLLRAGKAGDRSSVLDYWKTHYGASVMAKNEDRDDDRESVKDDRESEDHHANAVRMAGLGDDAVWSATPLGSTLHVLRSGTIVRISVGGSAPLDQKLEASRLLAAAILRRLP
jgi:hypothetical protein